MSSITQLLNAVSAANSGGRRLSHRHDTEYARRT